MEEVFLDYLLFINIFFIVYFITFLIFNSNIIFSQVNLLVLYEGEERSEHLCVARANPYSLFHGENGKIIEKIIEKRINLFLSFKF